MQRYLTQTRAESLKKTEKKKKSYQFSDLYPSMFESGGKYVNSGKCHVAILYVGEKTLPVGLFPKSECPVCHQVSLTPYEVVASVLSGAHTIKAHCEHCRENIGFNDSDYYHVVRDIMMKQCKNIAFMEPTEHLSYTVVGTSEEKNRNV